MRSADASRMYRTGDVWDSPIWAGSGSPVQGLHRTWTVVVPVVVPVLLTGEREARWWLYSVHDDFFVAAEMFDLARRESKAPLLIKAAPDADGVVSARSTRTVVCVGAPPSSL